MSYLGRRGASAALTSADIPNDSITAAKIVDGAVTSDLVYLENATTTQNLSGTYSTERMYLNDSYTLTGDVTITGHLALGTIADKDVLIEANTGSTERTITGEGTLESGELLKSEQSDLTGMTGELGSAVTGSPAITGFGTVTSGTLGSGVTFPAGHIVQVVQVVIRDSFATSSTSFVATDTTGAITPSSTSNKVLVSIVSVIDTGANERTPQMMLYRNGSAVSNASEGLMQAKSGAGGHIRVPFAINWLDSPSSTNQVTYTLYVKDSGSGGTVECPPYANMDQTLTMMEIKG